MILFGTCVSTTHKTKQKMFSQDAQALLLTLTSHSPTPDNFDIQAMECKSELEERKLNGDNELSLLLAKNEEEGSLMEAVGLGPWYRKAQLGFMFGVTAVSKEMYILNEETYVGLCLGGFGFLLYMYARQPVLDWYNGEKSAILKAQNEAEDKHIAACQTFLNSQTGNEGLENELEQIYNENLELIALEAKANALKEKISVKADFERKLMSVVNKKADEQNQLYKKLVADAKEYAAKAVQDAAFKKGALEFAIKAIATPEKAGANPTAKVFEDFLEKSK
jgi:hypothetical protein